MHKQTLWWRAALSVLLAGFAGAPPTRAGDAEMEAKRAAEIGLQPGMVLDGKTAALAKDLLPPEILVHYEKGQYRNEIVDWPPGKGTLGPEFEERTKQNAAALDVDGSGTIVEKASGRQPAYVAGTPFPAISRDDPRAGVKVLWNHFYSYWWNGNSHNSVELVWLGPDGVDRKAGQEVYFKYWDGVPEAFRPRENPNNVLMQFLAATSFPADLYGTTALTWRYRDAAKRDSVWAYVPALRRIRALSPSNRSDGFLGSDMSQDDGPFFDGKPEDFEWKLAGEAEVLRPVDGTRLAGEAKVVPLPDGGWRGVFSSEPFYGFEDPNWKGLPWAPIVQKLARRKAWIIEGVPKDRYYLYGKIQLWIDQENWQGIYNRKFSWSGELLNTYLVSGGPGARNAGEFHTWSGPGGASVTQIAENLKMNRATVAAADPARKSPNDRHVPIEERFFDYQSLYRFGK